MATYYIGADVDSKMTDLAVTDKNGKVKTFRVPTTIPAIRSVLRSISGRTKLVIEEGTMAGWLYRNLRDEVDELIVCDPRKNALIYKDGDKYDPIDAGKLAALLRGNYLRAVYHSRDEQRVQFKQWVSLYHDRVRDAVRQTNKLRAMGYPYGIRLARRVLKDYPYRHEWLSQIDSSLRRQFELLLMGFDCVDRQKTFAKRQLISYSNLYEIIKDWQAIPVISTIRSASFFVWVDTPFRFSSPKKLWKYCGVGLIRNASGKDKEGQPRQGKLQLAWAVNRQLKNVVMGAAKSAIAQRQNVFYCYYERLVQKGVSLGNARHSVARKLASVMWGMWKTSRRFDESLVLSESGS